MDFFVSLAQEGKINNQKIENKQQKISVSAIGQLVI